jgi:hypothetical protein
MSIIYLEPTIEENAKSTLVTFVNDETNKQYSRYINVPYHKSNNTVNVELFNSWLNDHLSAIIYKDEIGIIEFVDPQTPNTSNTIIGTE